RPLPGVRTPRSAQPPSLKSSAAWDPELCVRLDSAMAAPGMESSHDFRSRARALRAGSPARIAPGRHAELRPEAPDEVGGIVDPDVERAGGDRIAARREPLRRRAQPGTQQPLVRRDPGRFAEGAEEVVGAQTRDPGELRERVALVEPGLEPAQHA